MFSFRLNNLTLVVPQYLLQLYDRVIPNRSALDVIRSTLLALGWKHVFPASCLTVLLKKRMKGSASVQGLRDMNTVRNIFTGSRLLPLLDAPWLPLFIVVLYILYPLISSLTLVVAIVLIVLAIINEFVEIDLVVELRRGKIETVTDEHRDRAIQRRQKQR